MHSPFITPLPPAPYACICMIISPIHAWLDIQHQLNSKGRFGMINNIQKKWGYLISLWIDSYYWLVFNS